MNKGKLHCVTNKWRYESSYKLCSQNRSVCKCLIHLHCEACFIMLHMWCFCFTYTVTSKGLCHLHIFNNTVIHFIYIIYNLLYLR